MSQISAINCIEVPDGYEEIAIEIREQYVNYFKKQPGFISSTFYRASVQNDKINYINIVVWETKEAYDAVVNKGYENADGLNSDGMKVLGKGFPEPIKVHPGVFEIISR
ncbi:antibiotic biosynthesis monooxygenase family protein [Kiloniella majae]|uniref:antibiotic biosynthesis monooxygenase family protein n=1 Tax=Kiloniella majae TaxID=1938558 RepID=UPI000A2783C2|nr:antibiotic biosynthesis monooxygenase [Kiloniella majae]